MELTLREITAPEGYEIAEDVKFTLEDMMEVQKVEMMFPFQQAEFSGETGLLEYVRQAKSLGLFGTGELCGDPEQVLTLVSCSYEWESARNVVVAVRKPEVPVA